MITVHADTYRDDGADEHGINRHSVEITIGKDRRRINAYRSCAGTDREHIDLFGLAVKFNTGAKVWPGHAVYWLKSGNVNNLRPNIDRKFARVALVGFFDDYKDRDAVRSLHNAVIA